MRRLQPVQRLSRWLHRRGERGYTLIEMMIATSLLGLISAAAFGVVNVMSNQAMLTTDRFTAQGEGQTIADRITKDLRTAVAPTSTTAAFASAAASDVVFYASLTDLSTAGKGPTRIHAYTSLVPGTSVYVFHEDVTPPDPTSTAGNSTYTTTPINRLDGQYIDTTLPIFTYYDSDGIPITPMPVTGLTPLRSIDAVGVTLRIRVHPHSPTVVISTRIHIRNVDYNPDS